MIDELSQSEQEFNTTAGIEDLLNEEEESGEFVQQPVRLKTGIGGNQIEEPPMVKGQDPNATRWLFNPFEVIDLRNEPTSCGMDYLRNVVFNRVKSLDVNIGKSFNDTNQLPNTAHNPDNYNRFARTALMIANELANKNGDKGVIEVTELLGQSERMAADLNTLLFGDEVVCVIDINNPEHPCPVLPTLLETLEANVKQNSAGLDPAAKGTVLAIAKKVRESIALGMRNARTRIDEAQKRLLDEKNPNRNLSMAEKRCYLALGEQIPDQMPFLTRTAAQGFQQPAGVSGDAIAKAVVAGVQAAMQSAPAVAVAAAAPQSAVAPQAAPVTADPETVQAISIGQGVTVDGKKGTVIQKPFGKYKVQFAGGDDGIFTKDQIIVG